MPHGATALLGTIVALLLVAGCASGSGGSAPSVTRAPMTDTPAFPHSAKRQSGEGAAPSNLVLVDVHATAAEDFDRIVLEFSGTGTPGWVVSYVDEPVLDGSGEVVDLGGRSVLDIYASDTTWPAPDYYDGPTRLTLPSGNLTELYVAGTFEGTTQVLAGLDGARSPFRVFTRTSPSRLVIDVNAA